MGLPMPKQVFKTKMSLIKTYKNKKVEFLLGGIIKEATKGLYSKFRKNFVTKTSNDCNFLLDSNFWLLKTSKRQEKP